MNYIMLLIIDTETTGKAPLNQKGKGYKDPINYLDWNDCRIVQIAWMVCDAIGGVKKSKEYVIHPKNFIIPEESTAIHGISQSYAMEYGYSIKIVLNDLLRDLEDCHLLVAHNLNFDYHVILAELYRAKIVNQTYLNIGKYCTMEHGSGKDEKWHKLHELYKKYFQTDPPKELHRALNDVDTCRAIYFYQQDI
jgi:DNA polymerase III epsilon subunit-like protein